jgi:putative heme-binding domain-containing protein
MAGSGLLTAYLPGMAPDHVRSQANVCDGRPHDLAMVYEPGRVQLFVDGQAVADQAIRSLGRPAVDGGLAFGRLAEGGIQCQGTINWVRLSRGARKIGANSVPAADAETIGLWRFDQAESDKVEDQAPAKNPARLAETAQAPMPIRGAPRAKLDYSPAMVNDLVAAARAHGSAQRGAMVFRSAQFACLSCHKVAGQGGTVGPDLSAIGSCQPPEYLAESVLWPARQVRDEYKAIAVLTADGKTLQGYKDREDDKVLVLRDPANGTTTRLAKGDIEARREVGTLMPEGLAEAMTPEQRRDVIRFLMELGKPGGTPADRLLAHGHTPAAFAFDRAPLRPELWPNWQQHVNRDRLYDFYAKEAEHFGKLAEVPPLLPQFPGLDGGTYGHWGNQKEATWADDRWNQTDLGTMQCGVFRAGGLTVPRAVCVRLGDRGELAACFNPETLCFEALWQGGFLKFSAVRHGFMDGVRPVGTLLPRPEGAQPSEPFVYHGFYRHGQRVVFAYRIGGVEWLDAPWAEDGKFTRLRAPAKDHPLAALTRGGPAQWPQPIEVRGTLGRGGPYVVDTIPPPFENPWKALCFFGDHAFLPDGTALVCTMEGDVWRVEGLDEGLEHVRWRRFASGLHHAQGLVVAEGQIYVLGRDQITRLHDLNGDGEADYYERFSAAYVTSPAGHDFICGLQRDAAGRFYTASGNQGVLRIAADGRTCEVLATGFRNPDGLGLLPDGSVTVPCSEGEWTPASMVCLVRPEGATPAPRIGGHRPGYFGYGGPRDGKAPDLPLVYLPRGLDNSSGSQVYVESDRWGPLKGQMVHLSYGAGTHFLLLRDEVNGQPQGAVMPLAGDFHSGVHRGRFSPKDGQLYVSGMGGWGTYTPADGCFQRVRYTGGRVQLPRAWRAHQNGVLLTFTESVDPAVAGRRESYFAQAWNYRYGPGYGSQEFSPGHFGAVGHDALAVTAAHVLPDGHSVFLEMPELQPVNQLHLRCRVDGGEARDVFATVHELAAPFTVFPGYRPAPKTVAAHPILTDLAVATKAVPNPYRKALPGARAVAIEAGKNLTFATRSFTVKAGEPVKLTFSNPDVVPHNWVLIKPGTLERVGTLANQLVADPDAVARHYVPATADVLAYVDVVQPEQRFTIYFVAPTQKGRYPYLCSFPGHWMVMNGEMVVE